jgi:hypothetical protein
MGVRTSAPGIDDRAEGEGEGGYDAETLAPDSTRRVVQISCEKVR